MLSFDRLCKQSKDFSRLTGVKLEEFREIIRKVAPKWKKFQKKKKVSGRHVKPPKIEPIESSYSEIQKRKQKKEEKHIRETNGVGQNYILGEKFRS